MRVRVRLPVSSSIPVCKHLFHISPTAIATSSYKFDGIHQKRELSFLSPKASSELWTIPNIITLSRIIASPGLALAINYDMKAVALGGCLLFGFSDWLDGFIAKRFNQATVLGAFLDPVADKFMINALTVGLAMKGLVPVELASLYLGRDVLLIGLSFYIRYKDMPKGAPFFDTTYSATFQIIPSDLSKINTVLQFLLISLTMGHFSFGYPTHIMYVEPLWWITSITTAASTVGYLDGSGLRHLSKQGEGRGNNYK